MTLFYIAWIILGIISALLTQGLMFAYEQKSWLGLAEENRYFDLICSFVYAICSLALPPLVFLVWALTNCGEHGLLFFWQKEDSEKIYCVTSDKPNDRGQIVFYVKARNKASAITTFSMLTDLNIQSIYVEQTWYAYYAYTETIN